MKNPFEEYGFEPLSECFDDDLNIETLYSTSVNGDIYYIELADAKEKPYLWNIINSVGVPLGHDEIGRAENLSIRECIDYLSEYFPLVYGFSLEDRELFMKADLARFVAKESLSSDEWESLAYPLFENNYIDKYKPSEKSILGHLRGPEVFEIARRFQNGEDIRRELALGLLDFNGDTEIVFGDDGITSSTYKYDKDTPRYKIHTEKTEDGVKLNLFDRERIVAYEEIGQTFLDMIHDEFDDLAYWWVRDDMKEAVPDISDETIRNILTAFDVAAIHGWENDQIKTNRIKKAIFDELDNEEQTEKAFAIIAKEKYKFTFAEPELHEILFYGKKENLEIVVNASHTGAFGTTVIDGDTLSIVLNDGATADDIRQLVDTAQNNSVYLNVPSAKYIESRFGETFEEMIEKRSELQREQKMVEYDENTEKLKYMGIETEPIRSELAKAAAISVDMLDDLIKNDDYFVELANDYLRCLQNQAMDKANDNTAIISIPEYGLAVDLSKIDSLHLETEEWSYLGGTDSDGHERKDNYTKYKRSIEVQLIGNTIEFKKSDESDTWNPYDKHEFENPQKKDIEIITSDIKDFIKKADDLNLVAYTITDGDKNYLECKPSTEVDSAYLRCDLYHTARAYFSKELEKNMENGNQDIVFTKFYFEGDMVKLYPGRYSDVTDVPDWEKVRASLLQPENGVDDNVRVRCEQFVISCGDERESRNERDATPSELTVLEGYFKDTSRSDYSISNKLDNRLQRTYDDAEYVMMYLDPDDVVYDLLLNGEKKHTDSPEMSNSAFKEIYIMSNPRFALEQIKLNDCEWKKWDEAIMYMTDNKLSADSIDMVAVKCYDNDGRPGVKDLTPEGLYVLNQHTIKSSIAAGIARQKYEELLKSAENAGASEESQTDSRKKNGGRR